jgi:hypothetical protein
MNTRHVFESLVEQIYLLIGPVCSLNFDGETLKQASIATRQLIAMGDIKKPPIKDGRPL